MKSHPRAAYTVTFAALLITASFLTYVATSPPYDIVAVRTTYDGYLSGLLTKGHYIQADRFSFTSPSQLPPYPTFSNGLVLDWTPRGTAPPLSGPLLLTPIFIVPVGSSAPYFVDFINLANGTDVWNGTFSNLFFPANPPQIPLVGLTLSDAIYTFKTSGRVFPARYELSLHQGPWSTFLAPSYLNLTDNILSMDLTLMTQGFFPYSTVLISLARLDVAVDQRFFHFTQPVQMILRGQLGMDLELESAVNLTMTLNPDTQFALSNVSLLLTLIKGTLSRPEGVKDVSGNLSVSDSPETDIHVSEILPNTASASSFLTQDVLKMQVHFFAGFADLNGSPITTVRQATLSSFQISEIEATVVILTGFAGAVGGPMLAVWFKTPQGNRHRDEEQ